MSSSYAKINWNFFLQFCKMDDNETKVNATDQKREEEKEDDCYAECCDLGLLCLSCFELFAECFSLCNN